MALADDGEIFWRDAKLLRKIFYRLMLDFALLQHLQELIKEIAGTGSQLGAPLSGSEVQRPQFVETISP